METRDDMNKIVAVARTLPRFNYILLLLPFRNPFHPLRWKQREKERNCYEGTQLCLLNVWSKWSPWPLISDQPKDKQKYKHRRTLLQRWKTEKMKHKQRQTKERESERNQSSWPTKGHKQRQTEKGNIVEPSCGGEKKEKRNWQQLPIYSFPHNPAMVSQLTWTQ